MTSGLNNTGLQVEGRSVLVLVGAHLQVDPRTKVLRLQNPTPVVSYESVTTERQQARISVSEPKTRLILRQMPGGTFETLADVPVVHKQSVRFHFQTERLLLRLTVPVLEPTREAHPLQTFPVMQNLTSPLRDTSTSTLNSF